MSSKNAIACRRQPASKSGRKSSRQQPEENEDTRPLHQDREGNISRSQTHALKQENRETAHETRHDEHTGGYLSRGEQRGINQQENALNRQIHRDSR